MRPTRAEGAEERDAGTLQHTRGLKERQTAFFSLVGVTFLLSRACTLVLAESETREVRPIIRIDISSPLSPPPSFPPLPSPPLPLAMDGV